MFSFYFFIAILLVSIVTFFIISYRFLINAIGKQHQRVVINMYRINALIAAALIGISFYTDYSPDLFNSFMFIPFWLPFSIGLFRHDFAAIYTFLAGGYIWLLAWLQLILFPLELRVFAHLPYKKTLANTATSTIVAFLIALTIQYALLIFYALFAATQQ